MALVVVTMTTMIIVVVTTTTMIIAVVTREGGWQIVWQLNTEWIHVTTPSYHEVPTLLISSIERQFLIEIVLLIHSRHHICHV